MKRMFWVGIGGATGFVMGSRAGRGPYHRVARLARGLSGRADGRADLGPAATAPSGVGGPAASENFSI